MRKVVLGTFMMTIAGACYAAWLSSSSPEGSAIGDIGLPQERAATVTTSGIDAASPRGAAAGQEPLSGIPSATPGADVTTAPPLPEMVIAGGRIEGGLDAPVIRRDPPNWRGAGAPSGYAIQRPNGGGSSGGGFGGGGMAMGGGGAGGSGSGGGYATKGEGTSVTRKATTFTTLTGEPVKEKPAATPKPAAAPKPAAPAGAPSNRGGTSSGGTSSSGGSTSSGGSAVTSSNGGGTTGGSAVGAGLTTGGSAAGGSSAALVGGGSSAGAAAGGGSSALDAPDLSGDPFGPSDSPSSSPTPEPTTMLLLGTGLAGLYKLRRHLQ